MSERDLIRRLVVQMMDSGLSAEEVCEAHPELRPEVERRWRSMQGIRKELDAMFPTRDRGHRSAPSSLTIAPRLPGYEQVELVGRGGMGVVYKAHHTALNRFVAVKMLLPGTHETPHEAESLLREASAVAAIQHPHIVQVFDVGTFEGRPYFTMELLEGGSLAQRMGGTPQSPRTAAEMAAHLAAAVQVAHERGIVHRDLKPGNILFAVDGTPKIADFGLARRIAGDPAATFGQVGLGTPSYMAPEQTLGASGHNQPTVDIYALGAVLYDLLTGRPPFRADSPIETQRQVIEQDPAPPSQLNARVPRDLETICLACLSKDPARRYATAKALADDLRRFLDGQPIAARPVGPVERVRKWVRRNPARTAALLIGTLCVVMAFSAMLWTVFQRMTLKREVEADFAEVVRLESDSDWSTARNVLERARTRIRLGFGARELESRATEIGRELDLVDRLAAMRFDRAASREFAFDKQRWWDAYRAEFIGADLLRDGESSEAFAARVAGSNIKGALIDAMDDWAICATNRDDLAWLLAATRTADPDPVWRDRARTLANWRDPAALASLANEARIEEQSVPLMLIVAGLLMREKDVEEGARFLRRIQAVHPSDFWACFALAESLSTTDPDTVAFYQAAISLRPQAAAARVHLALALDDQGRISEAIESMKAALSLDAHNHLAQYNIARLLLMQRRYDEAAEHARVASVLQPDHSSSHGVLGSALLRLGRPAEAAESFRQAIALLPEEDPQREAIERALKRCEEELAVPRPPETP